MDHATQIGNVAVASNRKREGAGQLDRVRKQLKRIKQVREELSPAMNGTAAHVPEARLGAGNLIDRVEYIRLLEQALASLGFHEAAERLQRESGVSLEPAVVGKLRSAVTAGAYDTAADLIEQLPISSPHAVQMAKFLIWQQKYLEALEERRTSAAVECLRSQLAQLVPPCDASRLQHLSTCLLAGTAAELQRLAGFPLGSSARSSRLSLIDSLQAIVPPTVMLPERRLEALVEQALEAQLQDSRYHNSISGAVSLLSDYDAGPEQMPSRTSQVLREHSDEVWHLAFSHNGRFLASGCKNGTTCIWEVLPRQGVSAAAAPSSAHRGPSSRAPTANGITIRSASEATGASISGSIGSGSRSKFPEGSNGRACRVVPLHTLEGHSGAVLFVAWSPDDSLLATCSNDCTLRLWDVAKGSCRQVIKEHTGEVTAAVWLPSGTSIISGSHDKFMHMHSISGELQRSWRGHRMSDMALAESRQGTFLVATPAGDTCVRLYQLEGATRAVLRCDTSIMSTTVSQDATSLLVYLSDGRIILARLPTDLDDGGEVALESLVTYEGSHPPGHTGHWLIRSCFGGANQRFVLSGSEECKVYVWHRQSGELLEQLDGHTGTVNAVAWNPVIHTMFASASDDCTIRVWAPE